MSDPAKAPDNTVVPDAVSTDTTPAPAPATDNVQDPTPDPSTSTTEPTADGESLLGDDTEDSSTSLLDDDAEGTTTEPMTAPDEYETFAMPDGLEMNEELTSEFSSLAKQANLDQATAQLFVDMHSKRVKAQLDADDAALKNQIADWKKEVKGAPDGADNINRAKRVFRQHMSEEQQQLFVGPNSWIGSHPQMIAFLASVDRKLAEDAPPPENATTKPKSDKAADVLFGELFE